LLFPFILLVDFLEQFEQKFQIFGYDFQFNPLAYSQGGAIITMDNQRFDQDGATKPGVNELLLGVGEHSSEILEQSNQMLTVQEERSEAALSKLNHHQSSIDGVPLKRFRRAERLIQYEFDVRRNPKTIFPKALIAQVDKSQKEALDLSSSELSEIGDSKSKVSASALKKKKSSNCRFIPSSGFAQKYHKFISISLSDLKHIYSII
jgi:hypothetical protein